MPHILNPIPFPPVILILAFGLDLAVGDPEWLPHPVRWIGRLIVALEGVIRRFTGTPAQERLGGVVLAVAVVVAVYASAFLLLYFAYRHSTPLFYLLSTYIVWTSISARSLKKEADGVVNALKERGIAAARTRLSRIVGRDTEGLSEEEVMRAVVETVSENTSDGVVAPLFFLAIGGPPLMLAYKAINTLDSMVGYRNHKYIDFGRFSARLDDAANFIPARLSALLMVIASMILGYNWREAYRIFRRDGRKHPSPNSGLPEAAVAGALGVRLGGQARYGGRVSEKPCIGERLRAIDARVVSSSVNIMYATAFLSVLLAFLARAMAVMFAG